MTYSELRDQYLNHLKTCRRCVSSFSGQRYFLSNDGFKVPERYATVSQYCPVAKELVSRL